MRRLIVPLSALVLIAIARPANATPDFPDVVAEHLGLSSPPGCELCHTGTQARGTVTTPFGVSMRSRGAQAYDEDSIRTALDALEAEKKDSDGDGVPDIDELRNGGNPNGTGGTIKPEYGCAVMPPSSDVIRWELGIPLGALLALRLRRMRRTRAHRRKAR